VLETKISEKKTEWREAVEAQGADLMRNLNITPEQATTHEVFQNQWKTVKKELKQTIEAEYRKLDAQLQKKYDELYELEKELDPRETLKAA